MDIKEAILQRRSVRQYQARPVAEADLKEILEAGLYAPSAINLQPWYFVAIQDSEQKKKLGQVMAEVSQRLEPMLQEQFSGHPGVALESTRFIKLLGGAPVCILAFQKADKYDKTDSTIIQSVAAAIENMLLMAVAKGLGSCWLTAPLEAGTEEQLRDLFAPGKGKLVALITLGYPEKIPAAPRRKAERYIIL